jgi:hypothetical protein
MLRPRIKLPPWTCVGRRILVPGGSLEEKRQWAECMEGREENEGRGAECAGREWMKEEPETGGMCWR